ncbi:helix-turn-helix domain-containing protein [Allochromatium vinosum]|uniref:helix-turn-helix domain-containing protein n=1 Tax=Allochromatium vinosum TaxID=1049 RepID=UPI001905F66D|nr:hypothetical protein [Allochromatium vinosum]
MIRSDYYTKDEAAEELGVTPRTLDRWWAERVGPPRTKVGRRALYRKSALVAWVRRNEQEPIRDQAA